MVLSSITVPNFIQVSTRYLGQLTTPLALIFVGITIHQIGVEKLRKMPREVWLVLLSCFCYTTPRDVFMHNVAGYGSSYAEVFHPCFPHCLCLL